jgi:hypothetical protein
MEAESGGGSSSARGWRSARENSRMRGKGAGCSRGGAHYFVGAGDTGEAATGGNS